MFNMNQKNGWILFEISSETRLVHDVIQESRKFLKHLDYKTEFIGFSVVLSELLMNAIKHGNQNQTEQIVTCKIEQITEKRLRIIVEDQGKGFDYKNINTEIPKDPRLLKKRGYILIYALSEKIEFNEIGNCVTVYFYC